MTLPVLSCEYTGIGSLPFTDERLSCRKMFFYSSIPYWPQLPKRSFLENMYAQFTEGAPFIEIDEENRSVYFLPEEETLPLLEKFYERIVKNDIESFAITKQYATGLYEFFEEIDNLDITIKHCAKGQITGPISFGLSVKEKSSGKAILYNEQYYDAIIHLLCMKVKWFVKEMKNLRQFQIIREKKIIIFIDEPYLTAAGSAYIPIHKEQIVSSINKIASVIHENGCIAGVHCCGDTDWSVLMNTDIDILSFDAYKYWESLLLYSEEVRKFIEGGKYIAWGIVPSDENVVKEDTPSMCEKFINILERFENKGINRIKLLSSAIFTPSCGLGGLSEEAALHAMALTAKVACFLKERFLVR